MAKMASQIPVRSNLQDSLSVLPSAQGRIGMLQVSMENISESVHSFSPFCVLSFYMAHGRGGKWLPQKQLDGEVWQVLSPVRYSW